MIFKKNLHFQSKLKNSQSGFLLIFVLHFTFSTHSQIALKQVVGDNITPKSIVSDGRGLFSAQNMMYKHTVTLYSAQGTLLKSISDVVNLNKYGFKEYKDALYKGAPVEACFTPDGKYLWVSNYAMYGPGFSKEGCDGCSGDGYDPSFLYKINTINYQIESLVKVGSVPKYLTITENGKLLLVSNWTSSDISIIDLETETEIKRVKVGPRPRGIVVDRWNQRAFVAIMGSNKIAVINLLNYSVTYIDGVGRAPRHLILNSANTHLYVAVNSANKLVKINVKNRKMNICKTNSGPRSMVLSANEKYLYVVNYYANTFQKINAETMTLEETIKTFQKPIGIAGDWKLGNVWVSCYSGKIQVFNDPDLPVFGYKKDGEREMVLPKIKLAGLILNMVEIPKQEEPIGILTQQRLETGSFENSNNQPELTSTTQLKKIEKIDSYEVIVGSFSVLKNANHLQELLETLNLSSTLIPSSNGKMTMVSVGKFSDEKQAANHVKKLKLEHNLNAWAYKK